MLVVAVLLGCVSAALNVVQNPAHATKAVDFDRDALFAEYDQDGDGYLNAHELDTMYENMHRDMDMPPEFDHSATFDMIWSQLDADGDKLISKDEYFASFASGLSMVDVAGSVRLDDVDSGSHHK
ncbi:hypothetical protein PTSG_13233 [Salpingoeca rosetta]|uniref:EF-hand domain-containing protein n=1 Tax=Salpingoeca rosetta (strain ATCC 50818 / BSB-021) TaxID=946362 RepID=F2TWJ8_SALR5|nr:uncharacterized protein PTSG_13233 [Salpingoeca rosetta]EGD72444.1 hypothetical protein PTSG_13233 [Salpingoeca rosetta]|eukprot:XP_004999013.1 hypothetical protein PTSG_13233 [Salpingoeca rosetta]